jgi:transposase-like protein
MHDWWLAYLALGALTLFIVIWRTRRSTSQQAPEVVPSKAPRVLKPRTPEDCPLCRRPHPTPLLGNGRKLGVKPWRACKSRRGPAKRVCTAGHACPNPACDYHGNTEASFHALVGNGLRYGVQQLKCQACQTRFSSRWGTALYRLHTPARAVAQTLLAFNLGLSAAEVQLLMGHSDTTLRLWLTRAGLHAQRVHYHFFQNLHLGHLQFDALYTTLRDNPVRCALYNVARQNVRCLDLGGL